MTALVPRAMNVAATAASTARTHIQIARQITASSSRNILRNRYHFRHLSQLNAPSQPDSTPLRRPISQPTSETHPHLISANEITPGLSRDEYIGRRRNLAARLPPGSLSLYVANPQRFMTEDVPYLYHANTDLLYLTGLSEPSVVLAAHRPSKRKASDQKNEQNALNLATAGTADQTTFTLFVRPRDATTELWDGPLCGASPEIASYFAVDDVQPLPTLSRFVSDHLPSLSSFHFDAAHDPTVASIVLNNLSSSPTARTQLSRVWQRNVPPKNFVLSQRLRKSPAELVLLRRSAQYMAHSLNDAMAASYPDIPERTIDAILRYGAASRGAERVAFPPVVAGGARACALHYMRNDARVAGGELVMVDAGCELAGYSSDVSRSWPVSGKFSGPQRDLYALALDVQKQCISALRVDGVGNSAVSSSERNGKIAAGVGGRKSLDDLHAHAARELVEGLRHLGFMKGHSTESALATGAYSRYFPHALGHYLGMDVHDTHQVPKSIPLEQGMVVTVEPGLYCAANDENAPAAFRGIGLRIEDDVVVGGPDHGPEVLSAEAVKEVNEVEALVGSALR